MAVGFLIGAFGGVFIGMVIMALCVVSSRDSREENSMEDDAQIK